jgi:hypothetical protein
MIEEHQILGLTKDGRTTVKLLKFNSDEQLAERQRMRDSEALLHSRSVSQRSADRSSQECDHAFTLSSTGIDIESSY